MAVNPFVPQGTLNRVRGALKFVNYPGLNITAAFLSKQAISMSFLGNASEFLPTLTGGVASPQPYQIVELKVNLVRAQAMAGSFKTQIQTDTHTGPGTFYSDAATGLGDFDFADTVIKTAQDVNASGDDTDFVVIVQGIFYTNSAMWDL